MRFPSTLKRIECCTFKECKRLRNIALPQKLEHIGKMCFLGSSLESVEFPPALRVIGDWSFGECRDLKNDGSRRASRKLVLGRSA